MILSSTMLSLRYGAFLYSVSAWDNFGSSSGRRVNVLWSNWYGVYQLQQYMNGNRLHLLGTHRICRQGIGLTNHEGHFCKHFTFKLGLTTPNWIQQAPSLIISHRSMYTWWLQIISWMLIISWVMFFPSWLRSHYLEMCICKEQWM